MTQQSRTFVGFGFGAIQAGLFLYEAQQSRYFERLVTVEVIPDVVDELRANGGAYTLNIAHTDRIEQSTVGPIEIENPNVEADRERIVHAISQAHEISTAIPSVAFYISEGPGSLHRLLAEGLLKKVANNGPNAVIYAAENHNHAAELLEAAVMEVIPAKDRDAVGQRVQFLNTVIGKMSGVITDPAAISAQKLAAVTPGAERAFLVESFNRILISKIDFPLQADTFVRGIEVFEEKDDLLPFEEAKLYGHNATHALAAYIAAALNLDLIADLRMVPGTMDYLFAAFLEESGAALISKYAGSDPLFSESGYRKYVQDLLQRMTNPYLHDTVDRVGRDPARKLGWNDRLIGTMRLALSQGIEPRRYAFGTAAALYCFEPSILLSPGRAQEILISLWSDAVPNSPEVKQILALVNDAVQFLRMWIEAGYPDLHGETAEGP